tara:strand:- start:6051 stop:7301 length:1251 start_codon:yes stop_codon:yes gene_type:complete
MTVLCVNSGVTYADIAAADAAEGGTNYGVPTRYEQSGASLSAVTFVDVDYLSSFIYIATAGEETTGVITVGAQMTAQITVGAITNSVIESLRVNIVNSSAATGHHNQSLVASGAGQDLFLFGNLAGTDDNCIAHDCSEGWRAGSTNNNHISTNCTAVDCSGFGFLRPRAVNTVALNTTSDTYLQEGASSSNYWADDGNGSNAITEVTKTDIFEDYAGGDYRIKPTSSVGVAVAGAFINASSGISIAPSTINSLSVSLNPVIVFNSVLSLNPLAVNSDSISLNPTLLFGGALDLIPNTVNSNSSSLNPAIQFSASVDLSPGVVNSLSVALNPSIEYTSALIIAPQVVNSSSISLDPLIEFKSLINLNPLTVDSLSIALSPIISYGQVQNIGTVTAGFADDKYSVKYKLSGITVNFKE